VDLRPIDPDPDRVREGQKVPSGLDVDGVPTILGSSVLPEDPSPLALQRLLINNLAVSVNTKQAQLLQGLDLHVEAEGLVCS
jgi:hypothetical protein